MHYLGNKGSPYSGFYSPLSCIAWVYFSCGVAAQAHPADAAYLHGVVVTLSPATHASCSLSLFRQQNSEEKENCSPLQNHCSQHTIPSLGFLPISCHREQQDKGTCPVVFWMCSACDDCIYHCIRGTSPIPRREDVYVWDVLPTVVPITSSSSTASAVQLQC